MVCASCGAENAGDARYCARCGAEQPRAKTPAARGATIAIVASCVVVLLAGYGGWKLLTRAWSGADESAPPGKVVQVPAGSAPPPTDQSAAPLPPPSALPAVTAPAAEAAAESAGASGEGERGTQPAPERASNAAAGSRTAAIPRSGASTHVQRPRSTAPARPAEAPATPPGPATPKVQRMAATAVPAPQPDEHWTRMNDDLSRCTREDFINRVICDQRVRIHYCGGYWGKVAQCPVSPSTADVR